MRHDAAPASPCIGICLLDPATGYCPFGASSARACRAGGSAIRRGCLRSVAEIANWYDASAAEKRAILARLDERRRLDRSSE